MHTSYMTGQSWHGAHVNLLCSVGHAFAAAAAPSSPTAEQEVPGLSAAPFVWLYAGKEEVNRNESANAAREAEIWLLTMLDIAINESDVSGSAPWFGCLDIHCHVLLR